MRLALPLLLLLLATGPASAAGYDLRVTVDTPCVIYAREHGVGEYRAITSGLAREATYPVEYSRAYDFRAEGPAGFFHRWEGDYPEYVANTPAFPLNLRTNRVLSWGRVAALAAGVAVVACVGTVLALRRVRKVSQDLLETQAYLTEAEARSGLFPLDGSLPDRIGPYRVKRKLGAGGMAVVYEVDGGTGEYLALKLPLPNMLDNEEFRSRFSRELKVGLRLSHPNLVQIVDVNSGEGGSYPYPFLVMELVEGQPLDERIAGSGPAGFKEAVDVGCRLLDALAFVHEKGIVHRDIKPSNIMMTANGRPKLMDFGVAHRQETSGVKLTATDQMLGTPLYMAPEQIKGLAVDARADLYAVGMVLYEMLAGRLPFSTDDTYQTIFEKLSEDLKPLSAFRPDVPPRLEACVMKLVALEPSDRYATAAEAREALAVSLA